VLIDHSRRRPVPWAEESVRLAADHPDAVVGFGVAGDEAAPLSPYRAVVERAAAAGVHLVHHAGETGGAASVREALDVGRAERIGHGIRSLEDSELVARLRHDRVPLEVCPSSNVVLGLAPSLAAHPLQELVEAGLVVTLNTDIPAITGRTLSAEYAAVRDAFGCTDEELAEFARAAVDASFAPPETKTGLHRGIDVWLSGH
jgi:adenosine deaminase